MAKKILLPVLVVIVMMTGVFFWYSIHTNGSLNNRVPGVSETKTASTSSGTNGDVATADRCPVIPDVQSLPSYFVLKSGDQREGGEFQFDSHFFEGGGIYASDVSFYENELVRNDWTVHYFHVDKKNDGFWASKGRELMSFAAWADDGSTSRFYGLEYGFAYFDPLQAALPLPAAAYPASGLSDFSRKSVSVSYKNPTRLTNAKVRADFTAACAAVGGVLKDAVGLIAAVPGTQARCVVTAKNMAYTLYILTDPGDDQKPDDFFIREVLSCTSGS